MVSQNFQIFRSISLILVGLLITGSFVSSQENRYQEIGNLRIISNLSTETILEIDREVSINFKINYWEMPPSDLYVLILPVHGDQMILPEFGKARVTGMKSTFCKGFKGASTSLFKISPENYPISAKFYPEDLGILLSIFMMRDVQEYKAKHEEISFAFITSFGMGGDGAAFGTLKFTPPSLSKYYDGILIKPYIFEYVNKEGRRCASHNSTKMNSLQFRIKPDLPEPPSDQNKKNEPIEVIGNINIENYQPTGARLRLGMPNSIKLFISYNGLEPNTEIYVMVNTMLGNSHMRKDGLKLTAPSMNFTIYEDPNMNGGFYRISAKNKPAYSEGFAPMGPFEAAYIATIKEGGAGKVSETIEFTPPPIPVYYDGIKLTPLYFKWGNDLKHTGYYNSEQMKHIIIPIEGRR